MKKQVLNISFTSKIRFVPERTLDRIAEKTLTEPVGLMFELAHVKKVDKTCAAQGIVYCSAGRFENLSEKESYVYHWFPQRVVNDTYICECRAKKLQHVLKNLSDDCEYRGFLIGGLLKNFPVKDWFNIKRLSNKMFCLLKRSVAHVKKKDFTIFFAQDAKNIKNPDLHTPESSFLYCKKNDTYYVNCKKYVYNKPDDYEDESGFWHDLLDKNEIRNHFEYINVSPNDRVFASGEEVPKNFWDKNKSKH